MVQTELMRSAAAPVLADVTSSTGLAIEVASWPGDSIGYVVHAVGVDPVAPVWETYQLLAGGDGLALHPPRWDGDPVFRDDRWTMTAAVTDTVQALVQMLLWQRGLDPIWPVCPEHGKKHPLQLRVGERSWSTSEGECVLESESVRAWECPAGAFSVPLGRL